ATVGISYEGAAEDFAWLLPVPATPDIALAEKSSLDMLQAFTEPAFTLPPNLCLRVFFGVPNGGGAVSPEISRQQLGAYDIAVLDSPDKNLVTGWLTDNGYTISAEAETYIAEYL